jgi:hypothetical protein
MELKINDYKPLQPHKGSLAVCGIGTLGLITVDTPSEVTYQDGNKGLAWTGIHLTNKITEVGSPWSSRNPLVLT